MKRVRILVAMMAVASAVGAADAPLRKILVWGLGTDPSRIERVEMEIVSELGRHQVGGERSTRLFPQGLPASPAEALAQIKTSGCDAVLVLRRRATIEWEPKSPAPGATPLQQFLARRAEMQASPTGPIEVANAFGNGEWEINKGEAAVFQLSNEQLLWRGDSQIKTAKDLPMAMYYRRVAAKVIDGLTQAGLIPSGQR